jgi:RHS repeat-associated protein
MLSKWMKLFPICITILVCRAFPESVSGKVFDRLGNPVSGGGISGSFYCGDFGCVGQPPELPTYTRSSGLSSTGTFSFPNTPINTISVRFTYTAAQGGGYSTGNVFVGSGDANVNLQVQGTALVSLPTAPTAIGLNQKVGEKFPVGNLVVNSSFESGDYQFGSTSTRGWGGFWGGQAIRKRSSDPQFGQWTLSVTTTAENAVGQWQGAAYMITHEDPAFMAIENANAKGAPLTISAWVRAGANGVGKTIVFDNTWTQGNASAHTFPDTKWRKIKHTFPSSQVHPNTFAFRHYGFSIHEKDPSATVFEFEVDNVILTVGTFEEQAPVLTTASLSDGLARDVQNFVIQETGTPASPSMKRVVTKTDHDTVGRPWKTWLPFEEPCNGLECMRLSSIDPNGLYNGSSSAFPNAGGFAFTRSIYENDPLARTFQATEAGAAYQEGSGHIPRKSVSGTADLSESALGSDRSKPANSANPVYSYEHVRDHNGNETMVWKDQTGNLAKSSSFNPATNSFISTRMVYDDKGQLLKAMPIISCEDINGAPTPKPNCVVPVKKKYNQARKTIQEVSPDFGTINYAYDRGGKLRLEQNQVQAGLGQFTVYKYGSRGQLLETGLVNGDFGKINDPGYFESYLVGSQLQSNPQKFTYATLAEAYTDAKNRVQGTTRTEPVNIFVAFYSVSEQITPAIGTVFQPIVDNTGKKIQVNLFGILSTSSLYASMAEMRSGEDYGQGIEDRNWPYPGTYTVQTRNVYDDIANLPEDVKSNGVPFIIPAGEISGFSKGKLIASINYNQHMASLIPNPADRIVSTFNRYDIRGRMISQFKYMGTVRNSQIRQQEVDFTYDEGGRMSTKIVWKTPSGVGCADMSSYHRFAYDEQNRLAKVFTRSRTDCNQETQIASYFYSHDGKVSHAAIGEPADRINTQYSYHLHSWMKEIHSYQVFCSTTGVCNPSTIFKETLNYDTPGAGAVPRYNGDIAQAEYSFGVGGKRNFHYGYDAMDRLRTAKNQIVETNGTAMDEEAQYLDDGRISTLKRGGVAQTNAQPFKYHDGSNKLKCVDDHVDANSMFRKDRTCVGTAARYNYDASGNRTNFETAGSLIEYDWRGLPWRFTKGTDQMVMAYDAEGSRVSKMYYKIQSSGTIARIVGTHYVMGEKEIREENLSNNYTEIANLTGKGLLGRIGQNGVKEFYLKNHLGSTMTKFEDGGNWTSQALYEYFPYGKQVKVKLDAKPEVTETFTGKEFDEEIGLYYFGARYLDADLASWISPDAARQFPSPYSYDPDPVNNTDPDGNCSAPALANGQTGICFEAFIAACFIRLGGRGDGRTHTGTDPNKTARVMLKMTFDSKNGLQMQTEKLSRSGFLVPGFGLLGESGAKVEPGFLKNEYIVSIEALNGEAKHLIWTPKFLQEKIDAYIMVGFNDDGSLKYFNGRHDAYPSYGVYFYKGSETKTLATTDETNIDALEGQYAVPFK